MSQSGESEPTTKYLGLWVLRNHWACHHRKVDEFFKETGKHQDPRRSPSVMNWSILQLQGSPVFLMADPFRTYVQECRNYCAE